MGNLLALVILAAMLAGGCATLQSSLDLPHDPQRLIKTLYTNESPNCAGLNGNFALCREMALGAYPSDRVLTGRGGG